MPSNEPPRPPPLCISPQMWHPPHQTTTLVPETMVGAKGGKETRAGYIFFMIFFINCLYALSYIYGTRKLDDRFNFPNDGDPVLCPKPPP